MRDEIEYYWRNGSLPRETNLTWSLHTAAMVSLNVNPRKAVLDLGGQILFATILLPTDPSVVFSSELVNIPPPQAASHGASKLQIHLNSKQLSPKETNVVVVSLSSSLADPGLVINRLSKWPAQGPLE